MKNGRWPAGDRWMLGMGGLVTNQLFDDEQRSMSLRRDQAGSLGLTGEWLWQDARHVVVGLSYFSLGDAPVTTPRIPGLGVLEGRFSSRGTWVLQVGVNFGSL
jgi:hypothetical protein